MEWLSNPWITVLVGPLVVTVFGTIAAEVLLRRIPSAGSTPAPPVPGYQNRQIGINTGTGQLTQTIQIAPVYHTHNYFGRSMESSQRMTISSDNNRTSKVVIIAFGLLLALIAFALVFLRFLDLMAFGVSTLVMLILTSNIVLATSSRRVWNKLSRQGAWVILCSALTLAGAVIFWVISLGPVGTTTQSVWDLHTMVSAPDFPGGWFSWTQLDVTLGQAGKSALLFIVLGLLYLVLAIAFVCTQLYCWAGALRSPSTPDYLPTSGVVRRTMQFKQFGVIHPIFVGALLVLTIFFANAKPAEVTSPVDPPVNPPASTETSPASTETMAPSTGTLQPG